MSAAVRHAEVAIVGAGIIGLSIAVRLSEAYPDSCIVVLDRAAVGSGATRFSAGLHFPYGATELVRSYVRASEEGYGRLRRQRIIPDVRDVSYRGISSTERLAHVAACFVCGVGAVKGRDSSIERILGRDTASPDIGCFEVAGCHYAYPAAVAERIAGGLRARARVRIWEGVAVRGIESRADAVQLLFADGRTLTAGLVVLAIGPWINAEPFAPLLSGLDLRVKKVVAMHIDRCPAPEDPIIFFHDDDAFLLPLLERGHWLFSYTCRKWDVNPDPNHLEPTAKDFEQALALLARHAPGLAAECHSGRAFCDAYSARREPLVTRLAADRRIVFAGAANGSGYRLALGYAEAVCGIAAEPELERSCA
jgi:glycine/D-amino acid oxidase-like deaminating enzyme